MKLKKKDDIIKMNKKKWVKVILNKFLIINYNLLRKI